MNMKKLVFAIAGVALTSVLFAGSSLAASTWSVCTPAQIGPQGDIVRLQVTGCNIPPQNALNGWLTLNATGTDQQMATILTAMSLGKPVAIETTGSTDAGGYGIANAVIFNNK